MRRLICSSVASIMLSVQGFNVLAEESQTASIQELADKVRKLEERVDQLEKIVHVKKEDAQANTQTADRRERVRKRFEQDRATYSIEELREIEKLYQIANDKWDSPEAKDSLKKLIEKYAKANRTGCALLYLGQMSSGEEREKYLKQAIDSFSDCYYGNGVQVGAYARFYLAIYYQEIGKKNEASAHFDEIRKNYPDAINHKGRPLADIMPK